jgi:dethiobiotin synthetase
MALKLFITGTDTDIGKTMISALLAEYLCGVGVNCGYLKLVSCGGAVCDDCRLVEEKSGVVVKNVYHFSMPASPHLAAHEDGELIDTAKLDQALEEMEAKHDLVLIEGAGGLCVPLTPKLLLADYIAVHDVWAVVVARAGLGTINHTLLTLEGLQQHTISTLGIIFNDEQLYADDDLLVTDNLQTIHRFSGVPILGRVPRFQSWTEGRKSFAAIGAALVVRLGL